MLQRVVRTAIIDAPINRVWSLLRDFNSHDQWHSAIDSSQIENNERSDQVGCIRNFSLKDGNLVREQLLGLSDSEHSINYCIVEASIPLQRYVAQIKLKPVTDGNRTFWHWESTFSTPPGRERELSELVAKGVYETGFENFKHYLRQGRDQGSKFSDIKTSAQSVTSQRMVVNHYGGPELMKLENTQTPAPADGEVRIQQTAIGVNFIDVYLRRGWMPLLLPLPGVLGMEAAGTVIDVGSHVNGLLPGDQVAYLAPQPGSYCSIRCVAAEWVVRLPPSVEIETAAALFLKGLTADYLIRDLGRIGPGTRLLVHAAAGGVGLLVCSWARRLGAVVMGTVSSEEKARIAREYGCEHVIVTRNYQFSAAVKLACGGADVIIDGLGDAAREENLAALAPRGHWISLGQASGPLSPLSPDALVVKSLSFSRPVVFDYVASSQQLAERAQRLWGALDDGTLKAPPIERFALSAAAHAHARLESRNTIGPVILLT
jgi:NADPH2:quinone reductase